MLPYQSSRIKPQQSVQLLGIYRWGDRSPPMESTLAKVTDVNEQKSWTCVQVYSLVSDLPSLQYINVYCNGMYPVPDNHPY